MVTCLVSSKKNHIDEDSVMLAFVFPLSGMPFYVVTTFTFIQIMVLWVIFSFTRHLLNLVMSDF